MTEAAIKKYAAEQSGGCDFFELNTHIFFLQQSAGGSQNAKESCAEVTKPATCTGMGETTNITEFNIEGVRNQTKTAGISLLLTINWLRTVCRKKKTKVTAVNTSKEKAAYGENSMPDSGIMLELCSLLNINVNELLSGERIMTEVYNKITEENLIEMKQEVEKKTGSC